MTLPPWAEELLPIVLLLVAIAVVVSRLPANEIVHAPAYVRRRVRNWLPVGLTYAFLYMGRYNLNACIPKALTTDEFSKIYGAGALVYGLAFLLNGPLTDKFGGKRTIIVSAVGSLLANAAIGLILAGERGPGTVFAIQCAYMVNMYFQSFGAVAIVKVNSAWFHVRERGTFGGIFGILISLGIYFAFDWSALIAKKAPIQWVFFVPAIILGVLAVLDTLLVADAPTDAGFPELDVGDASSGDSGPPASVIDVAVKMFKSPAIMTIACVEFCSGYLRNAIMQYYRPYAKAIGVDKGFVASHWGMLLCIAGILGGMFAGAISDRVFQSRRGPVSAVLYGGMVAGAIGMFLTLGHVGLGWTVVLMSLCIIGVHGMLSGTASMDFGGKKNAGVAVGLIDGFVYLGTASEAFVLKAVLPGKENGADKIVANWWTWPAAILPVAIVGLLLATRVWNAKPTRAAAAH
ncbi:MAG: MFS transporter [Polyangiaceae bacterium]